MERRSQIGGAPGGGCPDADLAACIDAKAFRAGHTGLDNERVIVSRAQKALKGVTEIIAS
jgi:hypothetical protein